MFVEHICAIILYLFVIEKVICQESDCVIRDGSEGVCVRIEECPSIQLLLMESARPLPLHVVNKLKTCAFDTDKTTPKVCCYDDIFTTEPPATQTTYTSNLPYTESTTIQSSSSSIGPDLDVISRDGLPEDASTHPNLNLLPRADCGQILEQRVSNGNKTDLFEYPWMALLRYDNGTHIDNRCGGSLISDRYVLTAAHCVTKLQSTLKLVAVRLGEHDTTTEIDCQIVGTEKICAPPVQDIPIEEVFVHPVYNRPKYSNDIAVIRLATPADMTPEETATILLQALLPIVPNNICQTKFYKRSIQLTAGQMCSGGEVGIDSCKGDSGGPLFYMASLDGVRMVQFGIVSAGVSVCSNTNDFPGIYIKVGYYMRWILDQMRP